MNCSIGKAQQQMHCPLLLPAVPAAWGRESQMRDCLGRDCLGFAQRLPGFLFFYPRLREHNVTAPASANHATTPTSQESQTSFRCPVQSDCAAAVIRCGRRRIPAALMDCSLEGYTLVIEPENALRLQVGKQWILESQGSQSLVVAKWLYRDDDGRLQLALRRIKDLGRPEDQYPSAWFAWTRRRQPYIHPGGNELAFAGIAFLLFLLLALPGFGDRLGTSHPIQTAVRSVFSFFW